MSAYRAVLFSPDGEDRVTDYGGSATPDEVWRRVDDGGSRWFFYPLRFVIRDNGSRTTARQRIVDAPEAFEYLIGCTVATAGREIAADREYIAALLSCRAGWRVTRTGQGSAPDWHA